MISLVAIATGFVVVFGMIRNHVSASVTNIFLLTTAATSITGFMFPFHQVTPAHKLGVIALVVLAITLLARYRALRSVYVVGATLSLYLNFFVLIVQSFQKIPLLHALAPHQTESPFGIAQGVALAMFIVLGGLAVKKYKPVAAMALGR